MIVTSVELHPRAKDVDWSLSQYFLAIQENVKAVSTVFTVGLVVFEVPGL